MKTRRLVKEKAPLAEARQRLRAFEAKDPGRLWSAASLAEVIWPGKRFPNPEAAGRAGRRMLNQLLGRGVEWDFHEGKDETVETIWGYSLTGLND